MSPHESELVSSSILDAVLPYGGVAVMITQFYVDESGTHAGSRYMTVAGYLFERRAARMFHREWARDLKHLGLSHAHMTDCALGFGEYKDKTMAERVKSEKLLIKLIRKHSLFGISFSIKQSDYDEILADVKPPHTAYTLLLMLCVHKVHDYLSRSSIEHKTHFFFEAGHKDQNEANYFMNGIHEMGLADYFGFTGHSFVDKRYMLPLQASDMLAWQSRHFFERMEDGHHQARKDFKAMLRWQDVHAHVERDILKLYRDFVVRNEGATSSDILQRAMSVWRTFI